MGARTRKKERGRSVPGSSAKSFVAVVSGVAGSETLTHHKLMCVDDTQPSYRFLVGLAAQETSHSFYTHVAHSPPGRMPRLRVVPIDESKNRNVKMNPDGNFQLNMTGSLQNFGGKMYSCLCHKKPHTQR